jgi:hypothetical protein
MPKKVPKKSSQEKCVPFPVRQLNGIQKFSPAKYPRGNERISEL